jgi:hypothetical protein
VCRVMCLLRWNWGSSCPCFLVLVIAYCALIMTCHECRHSRKPWSKFINADNQHLVVPEVYNS